MVFALIAIAESKLACCQPVAVSLAKVTDAEEGAVGRSRGGRRAAGVAGALVEAEAGDRPVGIGPELDADLDAWPSSVAAMAGMADVSQMVAGSCTGWRAVVNVQVTATAMALPARSVAVTAAV